MILLARICNTKYVRPDFFFDNRHRISRISLISHPITRVVGALFADMDRIPRTIRTGFDPIGTGQDEGLDNWIRIIECTFLAFVQRGFEFACQYAKAANRPSCVTPEDCIYGLKYAARRFLYEDDFEQRVHQVMQHLEQEDSEDDMELCEESDESESSRDSRSSAVSGECTSSGRNVCDALLDQVLLDKHAQLFVSEEQVPEFTRAPETDPFVKSVHEIVDGWNDWNPTDLVERLLKRSIDNADQSASPLERDDVVFRKRRTEISKRAYH